MAEQFNPFAGRIHRPPLERQDNCETHGAYTALCHFAKVWTGCDACQAERKRLHEIAQAEEEGRKRAERWQKRLGYSGIPARFHDRTLDSFKAEDAGQKAALTFAQQYADDFAQALKTGRGAVFIGKPGTGKTHLACGIGLQVMERNGARVLFKTVQRAIRSIKDTWTKGSQVSESEAIAELVEPELLILDEVGVQFGSDFEKNTLFDVLNERYEHRRPTIFLSNLTKQEITGFLGERVMDRLREDGGRVIAFTWESYRGRVSA